MALFNAGRFPEALAWFRRDRRDRGGEQAALFEGHCLAALGRNREALKAFAALERDARGSIGGALGRAGLLRRLGRLEEARRVLESAWRRCPGARGSLASALAETTLERARHQFHHGAGEASRRLWRRLLELSPGHAEAREGLGELDRRRALARRRAGDGAGALRALSALLRREPGRRDALLLRAEVLLDQGCPASARSLLVGALRRDRTFSAARWRLSEILVPAPRSRRRGGAGDPAARAQRPLRRDAFARAQRLMGRGAFARAQALLRGWLRVPRPARECMTAWFLLAEVFWREGRAAAAARMWDRALALLGGTADRRERFRALVCAGRFEEAFALGEAMLSARAGLSETRALAYPWSGGLVDVMGTAHRRALTQLIDRGAGGPWPRYYRALLGVGPEGLEDFERLERLGGTRYGWMLLRAGWARLMNRDYPGAVRVLREAALQRPMDWKALAFLGESQLSLGRLGAALASLRRARRLAPEGETADARAWEGALELWAGRFRRALIILDRACGEGARWAFCWRAGAKIRLGRSAAALADLDRALELHPGDREAPLWRAEALRLLGRPRECERLLRGGKPGIWALANRGLAKLDLGDRAGALRDCKRLPADVRPPFPGGLRAGLERLLAGHGYRGESSFAEGIWRPRLGGGRRSIP